jgi:hypothetical protein
MYRRVLFVRSGYVNDAGSAGLKNSSLDFEGAARIHSRPIAQECWYPWTGHCRRRFIVVVFVVSSLLIFIIVILSCNDCREFACQQPGTLYRTESAMASPHLTFFDHAEYILAQYIYLSLTNERIWCMMALVVGALVVANRPRVVVAERQSIVAVV